MSAEDHSQTSQRKSNKTVEVMYYSLEWVNRIDNDDTGVNSEYIVQQILHSVVLIVAGHLILYITYMQ